MGILSQLYPRLGKVSQQNSSFFRGCYAAELFCYVLRSFFSLSFLQHWCVVRDLRTATSFDKVYWTRIEGASHQLERNGSSKLTDTIPEFTILNGDTTSPKSIDRLFPLLQVHIHRALWTPVNRVQRRLHHLLQLLQQLHQRHPSHSQRYLP
jgi:hypothetical protein